MAAVRGGLEARAVQYMQKAAAHHTFIPERAHKSSQDARGKAAKAATMAWLRVGDQLWVDLSRAPQWRRA